MKKTNTIKNLIGFHAQLPKLSKAEQNKLQKKALQNHKRYEAELAAERKLRERTPAALERIANMMEERERRMQALEFTMFSTFSMFLNTVDVPPAVKKEFAKSIKVFKPRKF